MRRTLLMRSPPGPGSSSLIRTRRFAAAELALLLWACATAVTAAPLWLDQGRPTDAARQAVAVLESAADDGLQPEDYDAAPLAQALDQAARGPALDAVAATRLDDALSAAVRRFLSDLHSGRLDPRQVRGGAALPEPHRIDSASYLSAALAGPWLTQALLAAAPPIPLYAGLRAELARYRALVNHPAWAARLPAPVGRKLEPGTAWAGLPLLTQRLVALGDLPPGTAVPEVYDDVLQQGVKAFQQRHALVADSVVGKATLAQLEVSPAARVRQIELAMERLRWTPLREAPRMIVVNIPEFVLRAYAVHEGKASMRLAMNVIVGKAVQTQTPLFEEEIRFIEFSPYWNVPPSIARKEVLPRLRRDPAYFDQQGFEFVSVSDVSQVQTTLSSEYLDAVELGKMRIRQRPGPQNALGDIKFALRGQHDLFAPHALDRAVPARAARLESWLHPCRGARGAGAVRTAQRPSMARMAHPGHHGARQIVHHPPGRTAAGADRLQHHRRQAGPSAFPGRRLRARPAAGPGIAPAVEGQGAAASQGGCERGTMTPADNPHPKP